MILGRFKWFQVVLGRFKIVLDRFRSFQLVLHVSKYHQYGRVSRLSFRSLLFRTILSFCSMFARDFSCGMSGCFPGDIAKFSRKLIFILKPICERLLLAMFAQNLQSTQCCPNTAEATLHKKINSAIMAQTTQSSICWKISIYKVVLICLSEHYTRKLLAQFWPIVYKQMLQCCLDLSRSTLHKEITCGMLAYS